MNNVKNNQGVTLTELMIVIVVMGIIALFAVPAVSNILESANKSDIVNTSLQLSKGAELFCATNMSDEGCSGDNHGFEYAYDSTALAFVWSSIDVNDGTGAIVAANTSPLNTDDPGQYVTGWDAAYTIYIINIDGTWLVSYYVAGDLSYGEPAASTAWDATVAKDPAVDNNKNDVSDSWTA